MAGHYPEITLVRHGETEWSASGKHTGRRDIPLTAKGEDAARKVGDRLRDKSFATVWSSPSVRARRTAELAGFGTAAETKSRLEPVPRRVP
jgi:broad specificity phosphatase PhoE